MTHLVRAELLRFSSRRMFRWLTLLALAAIAFGAFMAFISSDLDPATPASPAPLQDMSWIVLGSTMWAIFGAWVIGASFIGAEWQRGTMTTTLTWEARRTRVLTAKFAAAATGTILWYLALISILLMLLAPTMALHGVGTFPTSEIAFGVLRGAAVAGFAAVAAGAVAMVGRTTAAAIGGGFAWFTVLEGFGRALRPQWAPWFLGENAGAFLWWEGTSFGRGPAGAGIVVSLYAAALIAMAWLFFTRRDAA